MQCETVSGMSKPKGSTDKGSADQIAALYSQAIVSEIKAEMGRQNMSSRALGRMIGHSSQYVSMRLDGGNPKTGELVTLGVDDLVAMTSALGIDPTELLTRASARAQQMK